MATTFEALWQNTGIGDAARDLDFDETITHRTFAARRKNERAASAPSASPSAITLPALPHISVALPSSEPTGKPRSPTSEANFPDLEVSGLLGEGGMGRVLLARQRSLRREVAIKMIKPGVDDRSVLDALLTEAVVTGSLEHPSVVPIHALGCDDDQRPVLVMKRIEGVSWKVLARDERHEAWSRLDPTGDDRLRAHLEIFMQVCNALHFAHAKGFVHRDVKLDNVMIGEFGEVYVVDWGIAVKAPALAHTEPRRAAAPTDPGPLVGTPSYIAPEMLSGDVAAVDARTDVYLLGATLHALLTGEHRHKGDDLMEVLFAAHESRPFSYASAVPAELGAICNKATSRDPDDRYPTARALRRAVADYLRHTSSIALSDAAEGRLREARARLKEPGSDAQVLHRLTTECRFGFMQALREWKENTPAREGLSGCIEVMIELALSQKNADQARGLYSELPEPRPALARKIDELAADLRAMDEHHERLHQMERDFDLSVAARPRLTITVGLLVCAAAFPFVAMELGFENLTHKHLVGFMLIVLCVVAVGSAVFRERILSNRINRQLTALTMVWVFACLVHRIIAMSLGISIPGSMATEIWMTACFLGNGGIMVAPFFGWAALPYALGALGSTLRPDLVVSMYNVASIVGISIIGLSARRMVKP